MGITQANDHPRAHPTGWHLGHDVHDDRRFGVNDFRPCGTNDNDGRDVHADACESQSNQPHRAFQQSACGRRAVFAVRRIGAFPQRKRRRQHFSQPWRKSRWERFGRILNHVDSKFGFANNPCSHRCLANQGSGMRCLTPGALTDDC